MSDVLKAVGGVLMLGFILYCVISSIRWCYKNLWRLGPAPGPPVYGGGSSGDLPISKKNREQRPPVITSQPPVQSPVQRRQQVVVCQLQTTEEGQSQEQVVYQRAPHGVRHELIEIVYRQSADGKQGVVYKIAPLYNIPNPRNTPVTKAPVPNLPVPLPPRTKAPVPEPAVDNVQIADQQLEGNPIADAPPSYRAPSPIY